MFPSSKSTPVSIPSGLSSGSSVPISLFCSSPPTQVPVSLVSISLSQTPVLSNSASESSPLVSDDTSFPSSSTIIVVPAPSIHPLNTHAMTTRARHGKYIRDLLLKTNMASTKGIISHMAYSTKLSKVGSAQVSDPTHFRFEVGALQYATMTRPVNSFATGPLTQMTGVSLLGPAFS
ncbi:hypothetical protein KIW84_060451 [Lathyrus oleraceus]|uniref:Uncharacterized protein n=1 Tax=Pisum sativum TaxID=3888 RepID=A0A9D4W1I6_PEA|nr:hypothetical protein KIW84_060451 [Pisum sativum]